jgi:RimJ/RimL family protein N-acetyltransferase
MVNEIYIRDVIQSDLPIFYEQQLDPDANYMAAFTRKDPEDKEAFMLHWARILGDKDIFIQTILYDGEVAGSVLSYVQQGDREVSYWIGKEYWGKGIATRALSERLAYIHMRPIYARAAKDNLSSLRVLQKCGFRIIGEDRGFANAREAEIEEYILELPASESSANP